MPSHDFKRSHKSNRQRLEYIFIRLANEETDCKWRYCEGGDEGIGEVETGRKQNDVLFRLQQNERLRCSI